MPVRTFGSILRFGDVSRSFGVEEGPFDFDKVNMSEVRSRVKSLLAQKETLRKTINFDVMEMIDRVEAKDSSLKQMLNTVKKDRSKIEGTITKLNEHMLETLHRTWTKVNGYPCFGRLVADGGLGILDRSLESYSLAALLSWIP